MTKKRILLFLVSSFLFSCGSQTSVPISSESETANSTSSSIPESSSTEESVSVGPKVLSQEETNELLNHISDYDSEVKSTHTTCTTVSYLTSVDDYTSTRYINDVVIQKGTTAYDDGDPFEWEVQIYADTDNVYEMHYYGKHSSANFADISSMDDYTEEQFEAVFSLSDALNLQTEITYLMNDKGYTKDVNGGTEEYTCSYHASAKEEDNTYTIDFTYQNEVKDTSSDDDSIMRETMSYTYRFSLKDQMILSYYQLIEGYQYNNEVQYNYGKKETSRTYEYGQYETYSGTLYTEEDLN